MRTRRAAVPILALLSCAAAAGAEIVLLQNGERLEGQIIITYEKGLLFREKETSPGRYYPYGEVSRIITSDGMLYYLMPRGKEPTEKKPDFLSVGAFLAQKSRCLGAHRLYCGSG